MSIIYGKGLHSKHKNEKNEHTLKSTVNQLIKDLKKNYDFDLRENPNNLGKVYCSVKLKQEKKNSVYQTKSYAQSSPHLFKANTLILKGNRFHSENSIKGTRITRN
jgi:hypothetical protein